MSQSNSRLSGVSELNGRSSNADLKSRMGPDLFEHNPISSTKMTESTTNFDLGRKLSDLVQNIESNKVNNEFPTKRQFS